MSDIRAEEGSSRGEPAGPAAAAPAPSLKSRVVGGSFWTVVRFGLTNLVRLATNIVLTRLLMPEAFGLMALVSTLMTGLAMFSDMGLSASVVQNDRDDEDFLHTAWTLQVVRGGILWCFAALFSELMTLVYGLPELRLLILVGGLTTVIAGFNSMALHRMRRNLEIRKLALIDVSGQLLAGTATVACAFQWPSAWALVWGGIFGGIAKLVISHLAAEGLRPRFGWETTARAELLTFGKWIFISTILFFLAGQSDRLIFGKLLSISTLGVFSIAVTLAVIPAQIVWQIGNSVLFPALSRARRAAGGVDRVYQRMARPILAIGVLPAACLGAVGPELIEILYDPRYADAGWMIQILAVGAWLQVPQASSGAAVLAMGEPRWLAIANGTKFLGMIVFLPIGYAGFGPGGAIAGLVGAEFFRYVALTVGVRRFGMRGLGADLAFTLLALVATALGWITAQWIGVEGGGALLRLAGAVAMIAGVMGAAAAIVFRRELSGLIEQLRGVARPTGHSHV